MNGPEPSERKQNEAAEKKVYASPELSRLGDVTELTRGETGNLEDLTLIGSQ